MNVVLVKATNKDSNILHNLKVKSFLPLLDIYKDYETSPATEPPEKIISQINSPTSDYYIIESNRIYVGGIRIAKDNNKHYRVCPIFIISEYQNKGIAQEVFKIIEKIYKDAILWELDTILEETSLCNLYEKVGYKKTGKTKIVDNKFTLVFYEKKTQK